MIGWGKKNDTDCTYIILQAIRTIYGDDFNVTVFHEAASEYEPAVNEVQVPVLNREICNDWLAYKELNVTDGMICAGYPDGGKDACQVGCNFSFLQFKIIHEASQL